MQFREDDVAEPSSRVADARASFRVSVEYSADQIGEFPELSSHEQDVFASVFHAELSRPYELRFLPAVIGKETGDDDDEELAEADSLIRCSIPLAQKLARRRNALGLRRG